MKKSLIILSVLAVMTACKNENKTTGTNENGENLIENNANLNTEENLDSDTNSTSETQETALVQNSDESYTFRYNLKKGETYPFLLKTKQEQSVASGGQNLSMTSERTVGFDYFVEDVVNNNFKIKATFKGFSEKFKAPTGETLSYDTNSAKPTDQDVAQSWTIYKAIIGESFQMEVDNKGKVISVNGLDKVVGNVQGKLKNDFNAEEQTMIRELLNASLSNEAIKSQFEETLNIFPDKNLTIGEEWSDTQNISEGPIKGTNKVTRTFKDVKDGKATIAVNGTQSVSGSETQQGLTISMKNNATLNGHIDLDLETGWIKKVNITKKENSTTTYQQGEQKQTETGSSTTITTVN